MMLPRFTSRAEATDEPHLLVHARRLKEDLLGCDGMDDLVDEAHLNLAVVAEDADVAALAGLGDHLPGAGLEL